MSATIDSATSQKEGAESVQDDPIYLDERTQLLANIISLRIEQLQQREQMSFSIIVVLSTVLGGFVAANMQTGVRNLLITGTASVVSMVLLACAIKLVTNRRNEIATNEIRYLLDDAEPHAQKVLAYLKKRNSLLSHYIEKFTPTAKVA